MVEDHDGGHQPSRDGGSFFGVVAVTSLAVLMAGTRLAAGTVKARAQASLSASDCRLRTD
jgi:hypothetical protein